MPEKISNNSDRASKLTLLGHIKRTVIGPPRDLSEQSLFHKLSLIPLLAWIGLGADGLSSSCYGPQEAFRAVGGHAYLALGLAIATAITVFVISFAYSLIIEAFPHGGGGYVVASRLLGKRFGVLSGCALLVDYVLTITTSIAAAGDALFSVLPALPAWKFGIEIASIAFLITINLRGVRESVLILAPIFITFLVTHIILIGGGIIGNVGAAPEIARSITTDFQGGLTALGISGMAILFLHAYSFGGGTYTGIEATSNGLMIMREPRVQTGKRTMLYMAISLAVTAGGLLICYVLWNVPIVDGKTINASLLERMTGGIPLGNAFTVITLLSEGALLIVAAQAGFLDGPRVLANMANDSYVPRRFGSLSDRFTTSNGIVLMGAAALIALLYTEGNIQNLIVMYSINVFLTFSLSMIAMLRHTWRNREKSRSWRRNTGVFAVGAMLCVGILAVTLFEKFQEGAWVTVTVTTCLVMICFLVRRHYRTVGKRLEELYAEVRIQTPTQINHKLPDVRLDPTQPTAAVLVSEYSGLGIYTVKRILSLFPGYRNLIFLSAAIIDSGAFKGEDSLQYLRRHTDEVLQLYENLAHQLGIAAESRSAMGTDVVAEAEKLCKDVARDYPNVVFFSGKIVFEKESLFQRILHNETATTLQKKLQFSGLTMVVLPARGHA